MSPPEINVILRGNLVGEVTRKGKKNLWEISVGYKSSEPLACTNYVYL